MIYFVFLLTLQHVQASSIEDSASPCFQPEWSKPKRMEKRTFFEPSGNEFSLKCKIKIANVTKVGNGPVMWYQLLTKEDQTPPDIQRARLNETRIVSASNWASWAAAFGTKINPTDRNSEGYRRLQNQPAIQFQQDGQKIKFKHIAPTQDGFYTCIYRAVCEKQYKIIGITFKVNAQDRPNTKPVIVGPSPEVIKAKFNQTLQIQCKGFSHNIVHISWESRIFNTTVWNKRTLPTTEEVRAFDLKPYTDLTTSNGGNEDFIEGFPVLNINMSQNNSEYKCVVANMYGETEKVFVIHMVEEDKFSMEVIYAVIVAVIIISSVFVAAKCYWRQKNKPMLKVYQMKDPPMIVTQTVQYNSRNDFSEHLTLNPLPQPHVPAQFRTLPDEVRIDRSTIQLGPLIGTGHFGIVYKAEMDVGDGKFEPIAVKTLKNELNLEDNTKSQMDLINEFETMRMYGYHENLINLLGICATHKPYWLVMEYCKNGNLRDYLRDKRPEPNEVLEHRVPIGYENDFNRPLTLVDLLSAVRQIAVGMRYLAEHKNFIHRDLAARNILVTDNYTMKISDFGLAKREISDENYYRSLNEKDEKKKLKNANMPWRWMSLETFEKHIYTQASDVWSFGIVMWEIFTFGKMPYMTLETDEILKFLQENKRLDRPEHANAELYQMMCDCWEMSPQDRPHFRTLSEDVTKMLMDMGIADEYLDLANE